MSSAKGIQMARLSRSARWSKAASRPHLAPLATIGLCLAATSAIAEEKFRTDANNDASLPWFQLQPGKFPPDGSAHYFAGELVSLDPINRKAAIRPDRTDAQTRDQWDFPVDFEMLPYGSIYYHGAPAALRDIPVGTHLHGAFFLKDPDAPPQKSYFYNRRSTEADFTRCLRLEDDFTFYSRQNRAWRVESADLENAKLSVRGVHLDDGSQDEKSTVFDLPAATRVWKGREFASRDDIRPGQTIQVNLTWATLFGPGRCTDVWIDDGSRAAAAGRQLAIHRQYQSERGIAGWIDEIDNPNRILTVTLFDGVDQNLLAELKPGTSITAVVAEASLRTYDQVNDRQGGSLLEVDSAATAPGSSGVQIRFRANLLIEGFRPGRVVRVFPQGWRVESIPLEERLWPARD